MCWKVQINNRPHHIFLNDKHRDHTIIITILSFHFFLFFVAIFGRYLYNKCLNEKRKVMIIIEVESSYC